LNKHARRMAKKVLKEAETVEFVSNANVNQELVVLPDESNSVVNTLAVLRHYIQTEDAKVIVFFPFGALVRFYASLFRTALGIEVTELPTPRQDVRTKALNAFKEATSGALFSTDNALKNVETPKATHIIQG